MNPLIFKVLAVLFCFLHWNTFGQVHSNFLSDSESDHFIQGEKKAAERKLLSIQEGPAGSGFHVHHYRCEWAINPAVRAISGKVRADFRVQADALSVLWFDLSSQLTVDSVVFRSGRISGSFSGSNLYRISLPQILNLNQLDSVIIFYHGIPLNSGFGSFNQQFHAGQPIIWTMSCPYAASEWWPCINNHRIKADSIEQIISVPLNCKAAGNGKLISETISGSNRVFHWKHRHPIAPYLVATAVTNYSSFTTRMHLPTLAPGDSMPVINFVYPEALASAQVNLPKVMPIIAWYDSLIAPYPFRDEKYGHAQFGWGGGMEHQTMSFMTNFSFSLQAHELAHQWFGNQITCRSWRDVWLNEGWATYMAALAERRFGTASFNTWLNTTQNAVKASSGGSVRVDDTTNINRIFDYRLTYRKGALLLHMLRWELGDSAFWAGVRQYQTNPQLMGGYADTRQFLQHLELASGKNLSDFEQEWFYGQGYPVLQLKLSAEGNNSYRLRITQTGSHSSVSFFHLKIPVKISGGGQESNLIFYPDSSGQEFVFTLPFQPVSLIFDPQKWLLAKATVQVLTDVKQPLPSAVPIKIQPNPFTDSLELELLKSDVSFRLFDMLGREVLRNFSPLPGKQKISTARLIPGNYLLLWERDQYSGVEKVMKAIR
jgi:aminopeptidase N